MEQLSELLKNKYKIEELKKKRKRGSELDAMLEEIGTIVEFTQRYGIGFWRRTLSKKQICYNELLGITKQLRGMDQKYNRGATLVNIIKKLPNKKPIMEMTLFGLQEKPKKKVFHKK